MIEIHVIQKLWKRVQKSLYKRTTKTGLIPDQSNIRAYERGRLSSDRLIKLKSYELAFGFDEILTKYFVAH